MQGRERGDAKKQDMKIKYDEAAWLQGGSRMRMTSIELGTLDDRESFSNVNDQVSAYTIRRRHSVKETAIKIEPIATAEVLEDCCKKKKQQTRQVCCRGEIVLGRIPRMR